MEKLIYNEFQLVGVDYIDAEKVDTYNSDMSFREVKHEHELIFNHLKLSKNSSLLDIGAGTGLFAIEAAKICQKVIAIDISEVMLEQARKFAKSENLKNISFIKGGFLSFDYKGPLLNHVTSFLALHHLPDFWKQIALLKINKMLKLDGNFFLGDQVYSFKADEYEKKLSEWVNINWERTHNSSFVNDVKMSITQEFSTFSWALEKMLAVAGFNFEIVDNDSEFFSYYLCKKVKDVLI